jgi:hypothetical protein
MAKTIALLANLSTIIASIVVILAFISGIYQFKKTQISTRAAQATDLFLRFCQLNVDSEVTSPGKSRFWRVVVPNRSFRRMQFAALPPRDYSPSLRSPGSQRWIDNSKLAITESIYLITKDVDSWKETVKWMLENQEEFIKSGNLRVKTYHKDFRELLNRVKNADVNLR